MRIATSPHPPRYAGHTIDDIARSRSSDPLDAACDDLIADRATFDDPHQYAAGISTVGVNGVVVIDAGEYTGAPALYPPAIYQLNIPPTYLLEKPVSI